MKRLIFILIILMFAANVHAADYYLNRNATGANDGGYDGGTGDWNDAWQNSSDVNWVTLRGNTLWVSGHVHNAGADSVYNRVNLSDNPGGQTITVKKASASAHGTEVNWRTSYGTTQAVFQDSTTYYGSSVMFSRKSTGVFVGSRLVF